VGDGTIGYHLSAPFFKKEAQFFPPKEELEVDRKTKLVKQVKKAGKKAKQVSWRPSPKQMMKMGQVILPTFHVNRFSFHLNTDHVVWNAWLFPVFHMWRLKGHDVALKFFGRSVLVLDIDNSLHRIAGAFIHAYFIKPIFK